MRSSAAAWTGNTPGSDDTTNRWTEVYVVGMPTTVIRHVDSASDGATSHSTRSWSLRAGRVPVRQMGPVITGACSGWSLGSASAVQTGGGPGSVGSALGTADTLGVSAATGTEPARTTPANARPAASEAMARRDQDMRGPPTGTVG